MYALIVFYTHLLTYSRVALKVTADTLLHTACLPFAHWLSSMPTAGILGGSRQQHQRVGLTKRGAVHDIGRAH